MELLSVPEAARELGVRRERVLALIKAKRLRAHMVGGRWAVPADAVEERKRLAPPAGRPLSTRAAWQVIHDGVLPKDSPLDEFRRQLGIRAIRQRAYIHPSVILQLRAERKILAGGRDAADAHGVATGPSGDMADAYITVPDFDELTAGGIINIDIEPANILLHIAPEGSVDMRQDAVPLLAAWADLEDAGDRAGALVLTALRRHQQP